MPRFSSAFSTRLTSCSVRIDPLKSAPQLSALIKCGARVGQAALLLPRLRNKNKCEIRLVYYDAHRINLTAARPRCTEISGFAHICPKFPPTTFHIIPLLDLLPDSPPRRYRAPVSCSRCLQCNFVKAGGGVAVRDLRFRRAR